jgi:DNA-binding CsgD family transcriptional regulator
VVGDRRSTALLERTGGAALAVGAVATATLHLETAVRLQGDNPAPSLVLQLCQALMAAGRMADAAAACNALVARPTLPWQARLAALRTVGRALYFTGSADQGEAALEAATAVALENDSAAAVEPLLDQSLCAWLADGPVRALPLAAKARELAAGAEESLGDRAEATWGHLAYEAGHADGLAATEAVKRRAERRGDAALVDPAELAWPWAPLYQIAMNANYAGCYEESEQAFARAATAMEAAGGVNAMATVAVHLANVAVRRGRLEEALRQAARSEEFADLTPTVVPFARLMRAEALAWSGRLAESEACCKLAEAAAGQWFVREWLAFVRGLVLFWQGDERASAMFLTAEEVTNRAGIREPCHIQWQAHAVAAHLTVGRVKEAERVVVWVEDAAQGLPCRWPAVAARLGRARLDAHDKDYEAAEAGFLAALSLLDEIELPLHQVEAQIAYGGFLRHCGRSVDARRPFSDAAETATQLGAAHLAATARDGLNLAGGRSRRPAPDGQRLTPAELRVAQQAAAGLSNSEIGRSLYLSVNTVETHMKRVFTKLGIASRRQLMTRELPLPPDNGPVADELT